MIEGKDTGFVDYLYNGEYDYLIPFKFQLDADIQVELRLGTEVLPLVLETDYTIYEIDTKYFVSLTPDAEYPFEPEILGIERQMELTQPYSFDSGESFLRRYLENALDRLILLIQTLTRNISGALFFPTNEDVDSYLPNNVLRRGSILSFDDNGDMDLWRNGYDKTTANVLHEPVLSMTDATSHNTYYGTNDQEQFLPSQEGQIKSSYFATLFEDPDDSAYTHINSQDPEIDYLSVDEANNITAHKGFNKQTQVHEDMVFLIPADNPYGLTYSVDPVFAGKYMFHDPSSIDSEFNLGSLTHDGTPCPLFRLTYEYAHIYGELMKGGGQDRNVYEYTGDAEQINKHGHYIPQHSHPDAAENEMTRAQFHAGYGFTELQPGMCVLRTDGIVPEGFEDVSIEYDNRYIKFVDPSITTRFVAQPSHNHGSVPVMESNGDQRANYINDQSDATTLGYTGYDATEEHETHTHLLQAHTDGNAYIEPEYTGYHLLMYVGSNTTNMAQGTEVFLKIGAVVPSRLNRVLGLGKYMRIDNITLSSGGVTFHDHVADSLNSSLYSKVAPYGVTNVDPNSIPTIRSAIWPYYEHSHNWGDIHTDSDVYPYALRVNIYEAVGEDPNEPRIDSGKLEPGAKFYKDEGLGANSLSSEEVIVFNNWGPSYIEPLLYNTNGLIERKIYQDDYNYYVLGKPELEYPGHLVAFQGTIEPGFIFNPVIFLDTDNLNIAHSSYCMDVAGDEIHHLLGSGVLNTYDLDTSTLQRSMAIPYGCYGAEWSDFYYGIIAMMTIEGVYSLVYIRPIEPGIGVYVCDQFPAVTEIPKIQQLGIDGGICVSFTTGGDYTARLYFDLDKSFDFPLVGAGAVNEVTFLDKVSCLKIICEDKTFTTIAGENVKATRQVVKSYIPYVDKLVTEWTP